jgi:hypothetical protein
MRRSKHVALSNKLKFFLPSYGLINIRLTFNIFQNDILEPHNEFCLIFHVPVLKMRLFFVIFNGRLWGSRLSFDVHFYSNIRHIWHIILFCKIWGFHGDDYEEYRLLRCDTVWLL